jgi:hypothetical protein
MKAERTWGRPAPTVILPTRKSRWGRWYLEETEPASLCVMLASDRRLSIELTLCQTSVMRERWLWYLIYKKNITPSDIKDFIKATQDLVGAGLIGGVSYSEN